MKHGLGPICATKLCLEQDACRRRFIFPAPASSTLATPQAHFARCAEQRCLLPDQVVNVQHCWWWSMPSNLKKFHNAPVAHLPGGGVQAVPRPSRHHRHIAGLMSLHHAAQFCRADYCGFAGHHRHRNRRASALFPGHSKCSTNQCTKTRLKAFVLVRPIAPCSCVYQSVSSAARNSGHPARLGWSSGNVRNSIMSRCCHRAFGVARMK